jgi:hypothetical protein
MSTNRSKDRSSLCSFTFADGRQCRTPRAAHPYLCAFHARKDAQALAGEAAGKDIVRMNTCEKPRGGGVSQYSEQIGPAGPYTTAGRRVPVRVACSKA